MREWAQKLPLLPLISACLFYLALLFSYVYLNPSYLFSGTAERLGDVAKSYYLAGALGLVALADALLVSQRKWGFFYHLVSLLVGFGLVGILVAFFSLYWKNTGVGGYLAVKTPLYLATVLVVGLGLFSLGYRVEEWVKEPEGAFALVPADKMAPLASLVISATSLVFFLVFLAMYELEMQGYASGTAPFIRFAFYIVFIAEAAALAIPCFLLSKAQAPSSKSLMRPLYARVASLAGCLIGFVILLLSESAKEAATSYRLIQYGRFAFFGVFFLNLAYMMVLALSLATKEMSPARKADESHS
jgi:hypothetical protein